MSSSPRTPLARRDLRVPVRGGTLCGIDWVHPGAVGPPVVALHGLTANAAVWHRTVGRLGVAARVLAPDLRGRGASRDLPGPYELTDLADDVQRMLDASGVGEAVLLGHSMGAFLAARLAERLPDRVSSLLLVDGGVPYRNATGAGTVPRVVLDAVAERLARSFPADEPFRRHYRAVTVPGMAAEDPFVDRYLDRGRCRSGGALRWACAVEAARSGMRALYRTGPADLPGPLPSGRPVEFLWAGVRWADEPHGYTAEQVARLPAHVRHEVVPDTDHFTIVLSEPGARRVAARVDAALAGPGS